MGHTGTGPINSSNEPLRYWPIMQVTSHRELEEAIKIFHKYCDPQKMTFKEHLLWEYWNDRLEKSGLKEEGSGDKLEG